MSLNYDFDIFDMVPQDGLVDAETKGFLARLGLTSPKVASEASPSRIALFRDPETADALRHAPDALRAYFIAAGFGLNTYSSGAPRHRYPAADEVTRLEIIERLTELASSYSLPAPSDYPEGGGVFRMGAFLADLAEALPTEDPVIARPDADMRDTDNEPQMPPQMPPMFDTQPNAAEVAAPRRKFWQSRYFMAAVIVGLAVAAAQLSGTFDQLMFASL